MRCSHELVVDCEYRYPNRETAQFQHTADICCKYMSDMPVYAALQCPAQGLTVVQAVGTNGSTPTASPTAAAKKKAAAPISASTAFSNINRYVQLGCIVHTWESA